MKKTFIATAALVCCFFIALAVVADVSGQWTGTFNAPDGNQYPLTYTFKIDGSKLGGTLETSGITAAVDSGMVKDDNISFSVNANGTTYTHKGKYYAAGDSIGMDVSFEGGKSHLSLKRTK